MDLEAANEAGSEKRPVYSKLYDARAYLQMESLHPRDYDMVAKRMATDDEYYAKYFKYAAAYFDVTKYRVFRKKFLLIDIV